MPRSQTSLDEETLSPEEEEARNSIIRMNEPDLLTGLMEAIEDRIHEVQPITIQRSRPDPNTGVMVPKVYFTFHVRPLTDKEFQHCSNQATKFARDSRMGGLRLPEETDQARYRSLVIYTATLDDEKRSLWGQKELWTKYNVENGPAFVDAVLKPGEKQAVFNKIEEISGFQRQLEEQAKN
jgi:hypothetical protein